MSRQSVWMTAALQAVSHEHRATVRRPRAPLRAHDMGPARLHMDVPSGRVVALVGPNGSGRPP
jgi:ABC-type sulfate/molybdate transport systems ATPase subunit